MLNHWPIQRIKFISFSSDHRYVQLFVLIFAGEVIFSLPFHIARFFRPAFLEALQISNTQLGDVFALYGVIAMIAYFPGGAIADYFSARKLMSASLFATAFGGVYFYSIPSVTGLCFLFAYFGLTSILLFWAAMIKATREWGGTQSQGMAFGVLDGGRGLIASLAASVAVYVFASVLGEELTSGQNQIEAIQAVVLYYTVLTLVAAILIWVMVVEPANDTTSSPPVKMFKSTLFQSTVWLQGGIIIAAYCGFKALDNYAIYAVEVLGMNSVEAAEFVTLGSYSRPVVAIIAGLIADRWLARKLISMLFAISALLFLILAFAKPELAPQFFILANLLLTFVAVFALRAIYFALIEESKIQLHATGTAVGMISVIGFTPDIFFAPITGRILDANPGFIGFQHYFLLLAAIVSIGLVLAYLLSQKIAHQTQHSD